MNLELLEIAKYPVFECIKNLEFFRETLESAKSNA